MPVPSDSYESFVSHLADREYFGQKLGLERIQEILNRLGNPERKFPSIHIAGTNGKGSTAAMIATILAEAGCRVGLYTSPHLVDFCERIQVITHPPAPSLTSREGEKGNPPLSVRGGYGTSFISREGALSCARIIREIENPADPLTFFELATAIGFLHFTEEKVEIAVVEVGLGGRLDATNVITPLISVITTVGMDHTQYLGDSIEKIAFEKAGIIKSGLRVITGALPQEAMAVVLRRAALMKAPLRVARPSDFPNDLRIGLAGRHQRGNAAIALAVIDELQRKGGFKISEEAVRSGLANVRWPGRLETVQEEPWILLDGAHNPQAMAAVRQFLEPRLNGRKLKVLFGAMADKDLSGLLSEIVPIADQFIFVAPPMKRAASPEQLLSLAEALGLKGAVGEGRVAETLGSVKNRLDRNDVLLVTGSLFVVGEARKKIQLGK